MRHPDAIGAIVLALVGIIAIAAALTTPDPGFGVVGPAVLPTGLGVLVIGSALWLARDVAAGRARREIEPIDRAPLLGSLAATAAYLALFVPLGFVLSGSLYLVVEARILGSRSLVRDAVASLGFVVALYLLFVRLLTVDLPRGPLPL